MIKKGLLLVLCALILEGCTTKKPLQTVKEKTEAYQSYSKTFTINVENHTSQSIYVCCFYYAKGTLEDRWNWHKSKVISIQAENKEKLEMPVVVSSRTSFDDIQGCLSVFTNRDEAELAIVELIPDEKRIDIGRLIDIENKSIMIVAEQYGFKGKRFEYNLPIKPSSDESEKSEEKIPSTFSFTVKNNIGKDIYLTGFIYEHLHAHPQWDFEKLPVVFLPTNHIAKITIPTEAYQYDWINVNGYLAVFEATQKEEAEECIYESLSPQNKVKLGALRKINNQQIILEPKVYGVLSGFDDNHPDIEFIIKPPRKLFEKTNYSRHNHHKK